MVTIFVFVLALLLAHEAPDVMVESLLVFLPLFIYSFFCSVEAHDGNIVVKTLRKLGLGKVPFGSQKIGGKFQKGKSLQLMILCSQHDLHKNWVQA